MKQEFLYTLALLGLAFGLLDGRFDLAGFLGLLWRLAFTRL